MSQYANASTPSVLLNEQNKATLKQQKYESLMRYSFIITVFFLPLSTNLFYLFLFATIILFFLSGDIKNKAMLSMQHPLSRIAVGFFMLFAIAGLYSHAFSKDLLQYYSKMSKLLYIPFFIIFMREQKWRHIALSVFVASVTFSLIVGVIKWKFSLSLPYFRYAFPATVFKNYIDTNLMMASCVFILAQSLFLDISKKIKYLCISLMMIMIGYILWLSEGRAGYIILITLWILFCIQHLNFKKSVIGLLGLALLVGSAFLFSTTFQERVMHVSHDIKLYQTGDQFTSVGQRIQYAKNTVKLALEKPVFGWGTGSFKKVYNEYARENNQFPSNNPHNEYLNIFFQLGIIGILYLMGFFGVILWTSFKLPAFEKHLLQGALLALMLGSMANSWLMDFTPGYLFVFLFSLCAAALPVSLKMPSMHKNNRMEIQRGET